MAMFNSYVKLCNKLPENHPLYPHLRWLNLQGLHIFQNAQARKRGGPRATALLRVMI